MANNWKIANGATVKIGTAAVIEDATMIGIPGNVRDMVEITALNSTRKEYVGSDMPDSPEIEVTASYAGTYYAAGGAAQTIVVTVTKLGASADVHTFLGIVTSCIVAPLEVNGKVGMTIRIKPVGAPTQGAAAAVVIT